MEIVGLTCTGFRDFLACVAELVGSAVCVRVVSLENESVLAAITGWLFHFGLRAGSASASFAMFEAELKSTMVLSVCGAKRKVGLESASFASSLFAFGECILMMKLYVCTVRLEL